MVKTPINKRRKITTEKLTKSRLHNMYTLIYICIQKEAHIKRKYIHKTTSDNRPIDRKDETTFREYILKKKEKGNNR